MTRSWKQLWLAILLQSMMVENIINEPTNAGLHALHPGSPAPDSLFPVFLCFEDRFSATVCKPFHITRSWQRSRAQSASA